MKFPLQFIYDWYRRAIRNPQYRWWIILGTFIYFLSPIDIAPDIFPIAGQIDDFVLVTLLMTEAVQMVSDRFQNNDNSVRVEENHDGETIEVDAVPIDES